MNKKAICFSLKLLFVSILVCSVVFSFEIDARASQLVFGLDSPPERLIPIKIRSPQTFPVSMQIFEGLFDLNEEGTVIPRIIESWETDDFQIWTFHVRKGVLFQKSPIFKDGSREVTAEDVIYSLTRFCSPDSYSSFLLLDYIKGAVEYIQGKADRVNGLKLIGPYTLQVELIKPVPFFINQISTPVLSVFPMESEKKEYAEKMGLSMAVGTGPYVFKSMTETEIILEKNHDYWDSNNMPVIDTIIFRVIKNDQIRLVNLKRGKINLMVLPINLFSAVFKNRGTFRDQFKNMYAFKPVSTFNSHFIGINNSVISDPNVRRAMFWGTNRNQIKNSILFGHAEVTGGTVPPGLNGYQSPFGKDPYDPARARGFLEKSSYNGEPIELLIHDISNSEQIGQIFQAQMAQIGINIVLKKLNFGSVINRMIKGECQLFSMFAEYAFSSPEPILINAFSSSKIPVPNIFGFSNPTVDEMLNSLYGKKDQKESVNYCIEIESKIMSNVPAIYLYRQKSIVLYSKNLTGLEISGNNHFFLEKVRFEK